MMSRKLNNPSRARKRLRDHLSNSSVFSHSPSWPLLRVCCKAENFMPLLPKLPAHMKKGRMELTEGPNIVFTVQGHNTGLSFSAVKYLPGGVPPKLFPATGLDCFLQPQSSAPPLAHPFSHTTCQTVFKHPQNLMFEISSKIHPSTTHSEETCFICLTRTKGQVG